MARVSGFRLIRRCRGVGLQEVNSRLPNNAPVASLLQLVAHLELKEESGLPRGWHFLGTLPLCAEVLAGLCHSQLTVSRFS